MKKIISLLLAAVMLFSLGISAAAYDVTMATTEGHTYTAYQVFSGDLTEVDGSKILSNAQSRVSSSVNRERIIPSEVRCSLKE